MYAHLLERKADLAADVLAAVLGRDIHVARVVVGDARRLSSGVALEDVELHLRAEGKAVPGALGPLHRAAQQGAGIRLEGAAVGVLYITVEPHDLAVLRTPGQFCKSAGVGMQKHIRAHLAAEARNGRGVYRYARAEGPLQLRGHDGDVLLPAVHVAESEANELHVFLPRVLDYLIRGILHIASDLSAVSKSKTEGGHSTVIPYSE